MIASIPLQVILSLTVPSILAAGSLANTGPVPGRSANTPSGKPRIIEPSFSVSATGAEILGTTASGCVLVRPKNRSVPADELLWLRPDGLSGATVKCPSGSSVLAVLPDSRLIISTAPFFVYGNGRPAEFSRPTALDQRRPLTAATIQSDGRILVAQERQLIRLMSDGSLDPSFHYAPPSGTDESIAKLEVDASGEIYVTVTGVNSTLRCLSSNGHLSPSIRDETSAPTTRAFTLHPRQPPATRREWEFRDRPSVVTRG